MPENEELLSLHEIAKKLSVKPERVAQAIQQCGLAPRFIGSRTPPDERFNGEVVERIRDYLARPPLSESVT